MAFPCAPRYVPLPMQPTDLRIAMFSGNYNYVRDGANQALNNLAGFLLERGVTLRVYSPTTDTPAFEPTGDLVSVPAWPLPGGRDEYKLAPGLPKKVRDDLKAFAPNVVHASAPDILGHRALSWALRHNIPRVATLHTRFETYPRYYGLGFLEPLAVYLSKRFYNRADAVLVPGPMMGDILREWGVTSPITIWSRGVNHDRFNPARRNLEWRRGLGIGDDEVVVGFLGRLVLEKGLDVFAEVIGKLEAMGIKHRVLVIGKGPARDWFAQQVPSAVFGGFLTGDDLGMAVASLDIFFNPSITETFGNVTLEAMAAGVPVVAARATGPVGMVEEGKSGILVEPGDIDGYAEAIARFIQQPDFRRIAGEAGHERAKGYRWDLINQAVLDAYLSVAK